MEILPSEYQNLGLSRYEKIFLRNIIANDCFGYFILNVNPSMLPQENMHVLLTAEGIIFFKFGEDFDDASSLKEIMPLYINSIYKRYERVANIISQKLLYNKTLLGSDGRLKFPIAIVYIFPTLEKKDVAVQLNEEMQEFVEKNCLFKTDIQKMRTSLKDFINRYIENPVSPVSTDNMEICSDNINSILHGITPEYVTIRRASVADPATGAGADNELLVVTEDDAAVKAYRLDKDQINIANKIMKGEQLILACAGSGKSVLLIAKCFKTAQMNPQKEFLITCYNKNLQTLYTWFIDRAGLKEKNVKCVTFHKFCKDLLKNNGAKVRSLKFEDWIEDVIKLFNEGKIKERYYGIFIDEVQEFSTEWYKLCFNLLENKNSEDHIFVICGDKTQKIKSDQKHGKAPWNAGEGYPNYRGGNKSIRIEKNYRNCIEINEYINRYVSNAKQYLNMIQEGSEMDPDMFLRGQSVTHGYGVTLKKLSQKTDLSEANTVYDSIFYIHDSLGIPYDEIAVIMYNSHYRGRIEGWANVPYNMEKKLQDILYKKGISTCCMYSSNAERNLSYGDAEGVRLIKFDSVLGLDFRAAIICGLAPFGFHDQTKYPDWEKLKEDENDFQEKLELTHDNIRRLYVACTRAKEILHIILPESGSSSVYMKLLENSETAGGNN